MTQPGAKQIKVMASYPIGAEEVAKWLVRTLTASQYNYKCVDAAYAQIRERDSQKLIGGVLVIPGTNWNGSYTAHATFVDFDPNMLLTAAAETLPTRM